MNNRIAGKIFLSSTHGNGETRASGSWQNYRTTAKATQAMKRSRREIGLLPVPGNGMGSGILCISDVPTGPVWP
ncbi:MAG: hypothetical protein IJJ26_13700 [Victivallales bacterium]|nr:hypothetical protein [Victivallales bacterium]